MLAQEITTDAAVWDLQFCPSRPQYFAASLSVGKVDFYHLEETQGVRGITCTIKYMFSHQVCDVNTAVTYLAWHPSDPGLLGCTFSDGEVRRLVMSPPIGMSVSQEPAFKSSLLTRHALAPRYSQPTQEVAWCCSWYSNVLYSGGDDSMLRVSTDAGKPPEDMDALMNNIVTGFGAGVTSIILCKLPEREEPVAIVGSQDEWIRVYNIKDLGMTAPPTLGRRQPIAALQLDGPIYRLKLISKLDDNYVRPKLWLLASCQQYGTKLVKIVFGDITERCRLEAPTLIHVIGWVDSLDRERQLCYSIASPPSSSPYLGRVGNSRTWGSVKFVTSSYYERIVRLCVWDAEVKDLPLPRKKEGPPPGPPNKPSTPQEEPDDAPTLAELIAEAKDAGSTQAVHQGVSNASSEPKALDDITNVPASSMSEPFISHSTTPVDNGMAETTATHQAPPNFNTVPVIHGYPMASGLVLDAATAYMTVPTSSAGLDPGIVRANTTSTRPPGSIPDFVSAPATPFGGAMPQNTAIAPLDNTASNTAPASPVGAAFFIEMPNVPTASPVMPTDDATGPTSLSGNLGFADAEGHVEQDTSLTNSALHHNVSPNSDRFKIPPTSLDSMSWHTDTRTTVVPSEFSMTYSNMVQDPGQVSATGANVDFTGLFSNQITVPTTGTTHAVPVFTSMQEDQATTATSGPTETDTALDETFDFSDMVDFGDDMDVATVGDLIADMRKDMDDPEVMEFTKQMQNEEQA